MESLPEREQMITALRAAYAAFNRGDIDAAFNRGDIDAAFNRGDIDAAFNRGDIDAALQPLDAVIEWSEPPEFPGGGTYHGHAGVKYYLTQSRAAWAEGTTEPEQFISAGNRIVVFVHARFRLKGSSEWRDVTLADVYTLRNGRAIQMRAFADRQEALRWVGVEDPSR
jgi:uncharacterized protein